MKKKPNARPRKAEDDRELIAKCIEYAQALAAFHASFFADPDGNSVNAEKTAHGYLRKAERALEAISTMPARTPEGLEAKARLLMTFCRDQEDFAPSETDRILLKQFVLEVRALLLPMMEERWREKARKAA
ncbi:MAG: hypothetical protein IT539_13765 [Bradyrhizobiaceae bacterium]|nr:hypothetical protein [Bradyrhizobiaceae bacterium]